MYVSFRALIASINKPKIKGNPPLLLAEPESAVRESLKKAFLVLHEVAENVGDE
jgi:hypothetical protein